MTATELLKTEDTNFCALLSEWVRHREPPIPLIDLLLEYGMSAQAAVKWVLDQPLRKVWRTCLSGLGESGSKPFPYLYDPETAEHKKAAVSWAGSGNWVGDYDCCDYITQFKENYTDLQTTEEALCYLMDNLQPEPTAVGSTPTEERLCE